MPDVSAVKPRAPSLWRDLLIAASTALLCSLLAAYFDLSESLFAFTRGWESLQLDEWPTGIFVFVICLTALYYRRHAQLRQALRDNRALAQRTLDVQEAERKYLARELHDELGQYLNAIKLDSQSLSGATATRISGNADHVYSVVTDMIRRLRPVALDELGLMAALEACVDQWRASQPALAVHLHTEGEPDHLGETLDLVIYRVVQEALTNCVRHAGASRMDIRLSRQKDAHNRPIAVLTLKDDGAGLPAGVDTAGGHGLAGMRERVELLGGRFELLSEPGHGVTIRATFPLQAPDP